MKRLKVNLNPKEHIGPEDILGDVASPLYDDVSEKKLEVSPDQPHFRAFFLFAFVSLAFLASYLVYFVLSQGETYRNIAQNNAQSLYEFGSSRGDIISQDGVVIASSRSVFDIIINPYLMDDSEIVQVSSLISTIDSDNSQDFLQNKVKNARDQGIGRLVLIKNLTQDEVGLYEDVVSFSDRLAFEERALREYPHRGMFSHVLGYVASVNQEELKQLSGYDSLDVVGKKGIENYFEDFLRGTQGLFAKFVSSKGDVVKEELIQENERGDNLLLTINHSLQEDVYNALSSALAEYGISAGAAVVLDANSGAVLSMVSLPDFDPNNFVFGLTDAQAQQYFSNPYDPLFNRATSGEYAVGSVIKPFIAAAALEEGVISPDKYLFTNGYIEVPSVYDPNVVYRFNDWRNHGAVNMRDAIAVSSNVYFYTIGGGYQEQEGLGIDKIAEYLKKFSWGKKLGLDFSGERAGLVPTPEWKRKTKDERWAIGDTYNVSIGQGDVLVTPMQVSAAMSVFANQGTIYKPYVVQKSYSHDGNATEYGRDIINANFVSPSSIRVAREGLREAVLRGSSVFLSTLPFEVAGKTGTAQTGGENNAWFSGFGPYNDAEIVVTVLLEEGESSDRAVRVAHNIFSSYFETQQEVVQEEQE